MLMVLVWFSVREICFFRENSDFEEADAWRNDPLKG
jgi:hypothetical protein